MSLDGQVTKEVIWPSITEAFASAISYQRGRSTPQVISECNWVEKAGVVTTPVRESFRSLLNQRKSLTRLK